MPAPPETRSAGGSLPRWEEGNQPNPTIPAATGNRGNGGSRRPSRTAPAPKHFCDETGVRGQIRSSGNVFFAQLWCVLQPQFAEFNPALSAGRPRLALVNQPEMRQAPGSRNIEHTLPPL